MAVLNIGSQLGFTGNFKNLGKEAKAMGAKCFQFYTRNPIVGVVAPTTSTEDIKEFMQMGFNGKVLAHAPFNINLASEDTEVMLFAGKVIKEDLQMMEKIPGNMYNVHPGVCGHQERGLAISTTIAQLNHAMWDGMSTTVLVETMAGKGTAIGGPFADLAEILRGVIRQSRIGVCLDTCHSYAYGYDLVNNLDGVLEEFDRVIGLEWLKAIHLNDSLGSLGGREDRHAKIGEGQIGVEGMRRIINHPKLQGIPMYLETPNDLDGYAKEIELLQSIYNG